MSRIELQFGNAYPGSIDPFLQVLRAYLDTVVLVHGMYPKFRLPLLRNIKQVASIDFQYNQCNDI
jgi:hypothetical protein